MGKERSAQSYDEGYQTNPTYKLGPDEAPWAPLWYWALGRVGEEMIVELGCGSGHFAELLKRRKHPTALYLGIDFSKVALQHARQRAPGYRFLRGVLPAAAKQVATLQGASPPTVVMIEVLEHFTQDLQAIKNLPAGTRLLASVPRRDSAGHVRHFKKMQQVCARYDGVIGFRSVERLGPHHYVFEGHRSRR